MGCDVSKTDSNIYEQSKPKANVGDNTRYIETASNNKIKPKSDAKSVREQRESESRVKHDTLVPQESRHELQIPNHDENQERPTTGEEPKNELPKGAIGDCRLGLTDYEKIKQLISNLENGSCFEDPDFPADAQALAYSNDSHDYEIQWLRPSDIVGKGKRPELLVDGITRDDIKQGILADCWFLSSCAAVSQQPHFMTKIVPDDQPLNGKDYKGIVHFRFWRFGAWVDVYIDDLLPTRDGELIYARGDEPTEFWVPLIEKAYAKLHGSYQAIEGGQTMDALVDLTGGLAERYKLRDADANMYRNLLNAHRAGAFVACTRKGNWRQATKADANGLVSGHAYTVTNVMRVSHKMGEEKLLQIRNPWGNETEWKGSWSDHDSNWAWVDEETQRLMKMQRRDDGEFWMCFKDFCRQFQEVTICTTVPDSPGPAVSGHMEVVKGHWETGVNAGGSRNDLDKFATNPQYAFTLHEADDFDAQTDDPETEGKCSVVIALMQEYRRSQRHLGVKFLQIGFILYQISEPDEVLTAKHFKYNYEAGKSGTYINLREVSGRFELEPGHYVVIPSTFQPNAPGTFMLRIFAQKEFTLQRPKQCGVGINT